MLTDFQTPPRILIPKLVRSRDAWKAKATLRKAQRKALEIRVRDLEASREHHRQRADQLQRRVAELEARPAAPTAASAAPKKWIGPVAAASPPTSSPSLSISSDTPG